MKIRNVTNMSEIRKGFQEPKYVAHGDAQCRNEAWSGERVRRAENLARR